MEAKQKFVNAISKIIPEIIDELASFPEQEANGGRSFREAIEEIPIKRICTKGCKFLSTFLKYSEYFAIFEKNRFKVLYDIGFTYIRTFENEKREMTDNPSEFVKTALDICDKQKLPDLKSQAAKLLEYLCDKMDGCIVNTGLLCLEVL